jgi:hypothetical protein
MIPNAKKRKIHEEPIEDSSDSDSSFEDHIDYETTFSTRLVSTVVKNTNTPPTKAKLAIVEKLSAARNALHVSAHVAAMVGRETEYESIMRFFKECLAGKKGGSLYISGNPGTGKSRAVTLALAELAAQAEVCFLCRNMAGSTVCFCLLRHKLIFFCVPPTGLVTSLAIVSGM